MPAALACLNFLIDGACTRSSILPHAVPAVSLSALQRSRRARCTMSSAVAMEVAQTSAKTIHCLRHGETEMNVWLALNATESGEYQEPLM